MRKLSNEELGRISPDEFKSAFKTPLILLLDNVRSALNVGSIFRTADAFLLEGIYLCGITATPPDKEIHKTALGATETVAWKHFKETVEAVAELKQAGYKVYAAEQAEKSIMLNDFVPVKNEKLVIILGHEVKGVSQEVINACDGCLEIPQVGSKHSLNVSVSAGVLVWDVFQKSR